jgi:DNA repair protein SbcC/Rad50
VRLRHLRVKNIRSYVAGAIDFADGTTLISGDVGAGKTSLLYAIEMALFGTSEVDAAYLVRHGAPHAEVAVSFEDAEHRYEIHRRFRRVRRKGKETFEPEAISFSIDGAKTEYSATELRQRVIELLGFPDNPNPQAHSDLWRWAVYVPQERMRDILAAKPQDRLETVRKALGVERYRTAAENAQDLAADLRRSAAERRAVADRLRHHDEEFASWTAEADRTRVERVSLEASLAGREAEVAATRAVLREADQLVRRAVADRRELASLEREDDADRTAEADRARERGERLSAIESRRREAEAAERDAAESGPLGTQVAALDAEILRVRTERERGAARLHELVAARSEFAAARGRADDAASARERALRQRDDARAEVDARRREGPAHEPPAPTPDPLERIEARLASARELEREALTVRTRAESALHEFEELLSAGVCPRCGQSVRAEEFGPHRDDAAAATRTASEGYAVAVEHRQRLEEERAARERYDRARERWREAEREREAARVRLARGEEDLRAADAAVEEAAVAGRRAAERAAATEPAERQDGELRARAEALSAERARLAARLERASRAAETARAASAAVRILEEEIARVDREAAGRQERRAARTGRIVALRTSLAEAPRQEQRLSEVEQRLAGEEAALEAERRALVRVDSRLDEAVRRIAEAERGRSERAQRVAEATDLEAKAAWVAGPFRRTVLAMEQRLLAHAQAAFERSLTRYFAALIDDPALVARTDVAFTPAVSIEGEWTPAEALSGGERTSLALAFRLALAQVVRSLGNLHLDTILLDEPTDGFSPEQVVRMGELLDALALPQVVLVSHEDELAGIADRVVRIEKVEGRSVLRAGSIANDATG